MTDKDEGWRKGGDYDNCRRRKCCSAVCEVPKESNRSRAMRIMMKMSTRTLLGGMKKG